MEWKTENNVQHKAMNCVKSIYTPKTEKLKLVAIDVGSNLMNILTVTLHFD